MHVFGIAFLFLAAVLPLSQWFITVFGFQTSAATIAVLPVLIYWFLLDFALGADDCRHVVTYGHPDCRWGRITDCWAPRVRAAAAGTGRQPDPSFARTNVCHGKVAYRAGLSARSRHHHPRASARCYIVISNSSA